MSTKIFLKAAKSFINTKKDASRDSMNYTNHQIESQELTQERFPQLINDQIQTINLIQEIEPSQTTIAN